MQIKIPELKSRYIPVFNLGYGKTTHWWKDNSLFYYPNILLNLISVSKPDMEKNFKTEKEKEVFLLTDSGGFQVISENCNLNWKTSLLKQIELGSSKLFSFDIPPVKKVSSKNLSQFILMNDKKTREIIEKNLDVALTQSNFLKENYSKELEKFAYIFHGKSKEQMDFHMDLIDKKIGIDKFSEYFPGGVVFAPKGSEVLSICICARFAYEHFGKKGIYVHFLGMGSFSRMIFMIRNNITTFDSSSTLQGKRANQFVNPLLPNKQISLTRDNFVFYKQFCLCPVCQNIDYNELLKTNDKDIGVHAIGHNLWYILQMNIFLDAISKDKYTETILNNFNVNDDIKRSLKFCDYADKYGFEKAYNEYKHIVKSNISDTKNKSLFNF